MASGASCCKARRAKDIEGGTEGRRGRYSVWILSFSTYCSEAMIKREKEESRDTHVFVHI